VRNSTVLASEPSGTALCPVRCAATRLPSAAAERTTSLTSSALLGTAIPAGCWSTKMLKAARSRSQLTSRVVSNLAAMAASVSLG
jgi:hypothetical protein